MLCRSGLARARKADVELSHILAKAFDLLEEQTGFSPYYLAVTMENSAMETLPVVEVGASKYMGIDEQYLLCSVKFEDGKFVRALSIGEARALHELTDAVIDEDVDFRKNADLSVAYLEDFLRKPNGAWQRLQMNCNYGKTTLAYIDQNNDSICSQIDFSN